MSNAPKARNDVLEAEVERLRTDCIDSQLIINHLSLKNESMNLSLSVVSVRR